MTEAMRVLIVEDETLLSMYLSDLMEDWGHQVTATASRIKDAMQIAKEGDFTFAILDINVGGETSFEVAEILRHRNIPFVFASGYGADEVVKSHPLDIVITKPYKTEEMRQAMQNAVASR